MTVTNKGSTPDRLTCVAVDAAAQCQLHTMAMEQGVMKMRPLPEGLEIKPGETVELKPAGVHLMFMGLKNPLTVGNSVKATLKLEKAGTIAVDYAIQPVGATSPAGTSPAAPGKPMNHMRM
jgi:copper(I)-binding protein